MKLLLALMLSSLPGLASAANLVKLGTDSKCILGKCDEFDHIQSLLISHKLWIDGQKQRRSTQGDKISFLDLAFGELWKIRKKHHHLSTTNRVFETFLSPNQNDFQQIFFDLIVSPDKYGKEMKTPDAVRRTYVMYFLELNLQKNLSNASLELSIIHALSSNLDKETNNSSRVFDLKKLLFLYTVANFGQLEESFPKYLAQIRFKPSLRDTYQEAVWGAISRRKQQKKHIENFEKYMK